MTKKIFVFDAPEGGVVVDPNKPHPQRDDKLPGWCTTVDAFVEDEKDPTKLIPFGKLEYFVHMPNGRIKLHRDFNTGKTICSYLTPEENALRDEEERLALLVSERKVQKETFIQAIKNLSSYLINLFSVLSEDEQADFAPVFDSAEKRLSVGDVKGARNIVARAKPETVNGLGVQGAILQELDKLLASMVG